MIPLAVLILALFLAGATTGECYCDNECGHSQNLLESYDCCQTCECSQTPCSIWISELTLGKPQKKMNKGENGKVIKGKSPNPYVYPPVLFYFDATVKLYNGCKGCQSITFREAPGAYQLNPGFNTLYIRIGPNPTLTLMQGPESLQMVTVPLSHWLEPYIYDPNTQQWD